jgi:hypothetical protein
VGTRLAAMLVPALLACLPAQAQTPVRCDQQPTTALGSAIALANPGAILAITGMCRQRITISSVLDAGITITNETGLARASLIAGDGIEGQIVVSGPLQVTISGITLEGSPSDLGYQSVLSILGGNVTIENAQIVNGWRNGVVASANGVATMLNTAVSGNGMAKVAGQCDGIRASDGARLFLGQYNPDGSIDGGNAVTVENSAGNGISVLSGSSLEFVGGTVEGNGGSQIFIGGASSGRIFGAAIAQQNASNVAEPYAVKLYQASQLYLAQSTSIAAGTHGGGVFVSSGSSLAMANSTLANDTAQYPTLWASGVSRIVLSGGNIIGNAAGATAIMLDQASNLVQSEGTDHAPMMAGAPLASDPAGDTITGKGTVQMQSGLELGTGAAMPSSWTGSIAVTQNSAFRMDGGMSISGAVTLQQGSNGFFDDDRGGVNVVTGGVSCATAGSHISAPQEVLLSPTGPQAVKTGAVSPDCLTF